MMRRVLLTPPVIHEWNGLMGYPRTKINGIYIGLSNSRADYDAAFTRLYQTLTAPGGKYASQADATKLQARLNQIPHDYLGLRFALIASEEDADIFLDKYGSYGLKEDNKNRGVMAFGFDLKAQQGRLLKLFGDAGLSLPSDDARKALEEFDGKKISTYQLMQRLSNAGFSYTAKDAYSLFLASMPQFETTVDRLIPGLKQSVERAVAVDANQNGLVKMPVSHDNDANGQTRFFFEALKAGRFEEAYVLLAFTNKVGAFDYAAVRNLDRAMVLGLGTSGDLTLTQALDFTDALHRWATNIDAKYAILGAGERTLFDNQLGQLQADIKTVAGRAGMFVSVTGTDSLSAIAAATGTNAAYLSTIYISPPKRYEAIFLPSSQPVPVTSIADVNDALTARRTWSSIEAVVSMRCKSRTRTTTAPAGPFSWTASIALSAGSIRGPTRRVSTWHMGTTVRFSLSFATDGALRFAAPTRRATPLRSRAFA
ncbi:MAG: hypothetical protein ABIW83_02065 [Allosphingosinicella sp.]